MLIYFVVDERSCVILSIVVFGFVICVGLVKFIFVIICGYF